MSIHSVRDRGPREPAPERGDKRARILASALRVFAEKGFFGAKVSDIAHSAGVADGTIYLYFKSKDDLLISLFEEQMTRVNEELVRAMEGATDAHERLHRFVRTYVRLVEENPHATEVLTLELRQSAKFMKEYANPRFAEFLKILAGVIEEGQGEGLFADSIPAPVLARALFGLLDELALAWVTAKSGKVDIRKVADWILELFFTGIVVRTRREASQRPGK